MEGVGGGVHGAPVVGLVHYRIGEWERVMVGKGGSVQTKVCTTSVTNPGGAGRLFFPVRWERSSVIWRALTEVGIGEDRCSACRCESVLAAAAFFVAEIVGKAGEDLPRVVGDGGIDDGERKGEFVFGNFGEAVELALDVMGALDSRVGGRARGRGAIVWRRVCDRPKW